MGKHTTVSIPIALARELDKIVEEDASYNNRSEVTRDAIRQFLTLRKARIVATFPQVGMETSRAEGRGN